MTRASSISHFFLPSLCFPPRLPCFHPCDLTMHLAERHATARPCPICTLIECCLSQFIVSLHSHGCVTSGILPSCLILLPTACLQVSLRACLGSITPFSPSPVIELNAWTIRPCFKGNVKSLTLFTDINVHVLQHTFQDRKGLLFTTQFAQISPVIMAHTAFEDLLSKGFVQPHTAFSGHTLQEYSALASEVDILPNSYLIEVIFEYSMCIQHVVQCERQSQASS